MKSEERSKTRPFIKNNTPNGHIDEDKPQKGIRQRKDEKYLGESYYHHIECSVTNSLGALMWR